MSFDQRFFFIFVKRDGRGVIDSVANIAGEECVGRTYPFLVFHFPPLSFCRLPPPLFLTFFFCTSVILFLVLLSSCNGPCGLRRLNEWKLMQFKVRFKCLCLLKVCKVGTVVWRVESIEPLTILFNTAAPAAPGETSSAVSNRWVNSPVKFSHRDTWRNDTD